MLAIFGKNTINKIPCNKILKKIIIFRDDSIIYEKEYNKVYINKID